MVEDGLVALESGIGVGVGECCGASEGIGGGRGVGGAVCF